MSSAAATGSNLPEPTEQEIVTMFSSMMENRRTLISKIGELEGELSEYKRVYETISPIEASRRAYQLINGVLVQTTVGDVSPKVEANRDGIKQLIENLSKRLADLTQEMQTFQAKYNIQIQRPGDKDAKGNAPVAKSSGVLA